MFDRDRYEPKRLVMASVRAWVRGLDPDSLAPADAMAWIDYFAGLERLAAAGKTIAAGVVAASSAWAGSGSRERSPADWLARRTASTISEARETLATAECLAAAPGTDAAARRGELSPKQTAAIAGAVAVAPASEAELLALASAGSLQKLRDEAARVRAAAEPDPEARHERIRRSRHWRRWTDAEGARCGTYRLTPEDGARLEAAAQPFIDARVDAARRAAEREPAEAYAADGLVAMAVATTATGGERGRDGGGGGGDHNTGGGERGRDGGRDGGGGGGDGGGGEPAPARGWRGRRRLRNRRELIGLVDLAALRRGAVVAGETCEIAGVGPVPVSVAREVFGDALLRIVIRDGVDIRTVVHTGRLASAVQETAVLVRDGGRCVRPTCGLPASEIDHTQGFATTRQTTLDDLACLCDRDHDLKSRGGHTYRRDGRGHVEWVLPDGTVERERPPP